MRRNAGVTLIELVWRLLAVVACLVLLAMPALAAPPWSRCPAMPDPYSLAAAADVAQAQAEPWSQGKAEGLRRRGLAAPPGQLKQALRDRARELGARCRASRGTCPLLPSPERSATVIRAGVTDAELGCLEQTVKLRGRVLEFILEPLDDSQAETRRYGFVDETGEEYALYPLSDEDPLPVGVGEVVAQRLGNDLYMLPGANLEVSADAAAAVQVPIPAWAQSLGLAQIQDVSKGSTRLVHVMASDTNATFPYSMTQAKTQISDVIERYDRDVSWGQYTSTVTLFPSVVALGESFSCSPWSAFQQVLPKIDPTVNFVGVTHGAIFHPFTHCGWCGIANRDSTGSLVTADGTIPRFGTNLTRTSCTENRLTHAHEDNHNKGFVHAGHQRPDDDGTPLAIFDPQRPLRTTVWTYENRNDPQGKSDSGGHVSASFKGIKGWLDGPGRTVMAPTASCYDLRPVSSPDGLVLLGYPRGEQSFVSIDFRQPADEWELAHLNVKTGWDSCVYVLDSGGDTYLYANIRTKTKGDGCVARGEPVIDELTGARFHVESFTINTTDRNKSVARVCFDSAPTRVDTARPVTTITSHRTGDVVSGTIAVAGTISDADGNAIGGEWSIRNATTGQYAAFPGAVSEFSPRASGIVAGTFDTSAVPDGTYTLILRGADSLALNVYATYVTLTVRNAGGPTTTTSTTVPGPTTTSTSTTSSTTTSTVPMLVGFSGGGNYRVGDPKRLTAIAKFADETGNYRVPADAVWLAPVASRGVAIDWTPTTAGLNPVTLSAALERDGALVWSSFSTVQVWVDPSTTSTSTIPTTSTTSTSVTSTTSSIPVSTTSTSLPPTGAVMLTGPTVLDDGVQGTWRITVGGVMPAEPICWWQTEWFPAAHLEQPDPVPPAHPVSCTTGTDCTVAELLAKPCEQTSTVAAGRTWIYGWVWLNGAWQAALPSPLLVLVSGGSSTTTSSTSSSTVSTSSTTSSSSSSSTTSSSSSSSTSSSKPPTTTSSSSSTSSTVAPPTTTIPPLPRARGWFCQLDTDCRSGSCFRPRGSGGANELFRDTIDVYQAAGVCR